MDEKTRKGNRCVLPGPLLPVYLLCVSFFVQALRLLLSCVEDYLRLKNKITLVILYSISFLSFYYNFVSRHFLYFPASPILFHSESAGDGQCI